MKATVTTDRSDDVRKITQDSAQIIISSIKKDLKVWKVKNFFYHVLVSVLGIVAILGSVMVSVYLDTNSKVLTPEVLKLFAIASTVSLTILSAFNILNKTNGYIFACDAIDVALLKYEAKLMNLGALIQTYSDANKTIGGIDFNFDKKFSSTTDRTIVDVTTDAGESTPPTAQKPAFQASVDQAAGPIPTQPAAPTATVRRTEIDPIQPASARPEQPIPTIPTDKIQSRESPAEKTDKSKPVPEAIASIDTQDVKVEVIENGKNQ